MVSGGLGMQFRSRGRGASPMTDTDTKQKLEQYLTMARAAEDNGVALRAVYVLEQLQNELEKPKTSRLKGYESHFSTLN